MNIIPQLEIILLKILKKNYFYFYISLINFKKLIIL
jgi:hypothetical protein